MSYCARCEEAIAVRLDMAHMGLLPDSADTPEEQAEMLAYDDGLICSSRGKLCPEEEEDE